MKVLYLAALLGSHGRAFAFSVVGQFVVGNRNQHVLGGVAMFDGYSAGPQTYIFKADLVSAEKVLFVHAGSLTAGIAVVRILCADALGFALGFCKLDNHRTIYFWAFIGERVREAGTAEMNFSGRQLVFIGLLAL